MKTTDPVEHYTVYQDLYAEEIKPEHFAGAKLHPDYLLLEALPRPDERLSSVNKSIILSSSVQQRPPVVFKVVATGANAGEFEIGSFVLPQYQAGSKFGQSTCMLVDKKYIILTWGDGIKRKEPLQPQEPAIPPGLARILGV